MPVEERRRIALRQQAAASWGEEAADTLMELVTPPGHDPATKQDLDELRRDMRDGFARVDERFDHLEERMDARFAAVDERMDARFTALDERMDARFAAVDERMDARSTAVDQRMEARFGAAEQGTDARFTAVDARFASVLERMESMEHRLSALFERRISDAVSTQTRTLVWSQLAALVAISALALGLR